MDVDNIATHSSKIKPKGLFFAFSGEKTEGSKFIDDAAANGAVAVVTENRSAASPVPEIIVSDPRLALSRWAAALYDFPAENMEITGVTGTNGKTTVSNLIYRILLNEGKSGLIGTSGYFYDDVEGKFSMTTPQPHELHFIFREMLNKGVQKAAMEVSSHALELKRVDDIKYESAVFTNLTQDHLDFHENMENYFQSKIKLFELLKERDSSPVIVNADDTYGKRIAGETGLNTVTYGMHGDADYLARIEEINMEGTRFVLKAKNKKIELNIRLIGEYNVYNSLAAIAWAVEGGRDMEQVCNVVSETASVAGRLDIVGKKSDKLVVVDYAHTPDALENVLRVLREITQRRLLCVFGCGGDRDRTKRPLMGKVAGTYSDLVYITSDNPRTEEPGSILLDVEIGVRETTAPYYVFEDREEAIKVAIEEASPGDCVLIAGKGDEEYQVIGDMEIPFSDHQIADKYLK